MLPDAYQNLAMRTNDGKSTERLNEFDSEPSEVLDFGGVINGCLGLSGEAGEFCDEVKKWIFHGKDKDEQHLKKELGDVLWYVAMICHSFRWSMDEIMQMNIEKLRARYPDGFDVERSNNRAEGDV